MPSADERNCLSKSGIVWASYKKPEWQFLDRHLPLLARSSASALHSPRRCITTKKRILKLLTTHDRDVQRKIHAFLSDALNPRKI